jgi:hypothetical protein
VPAVRCGPRVLAWSLVLGAAYGLVAGTATSVQSSFGLQRFGGAEYVPRVIGLSAVRGWGLWGAALVPALTAVVVLHRAGRRGAEVPVVDRHLPFFVGAAALLLYPIVVTTGCFAAFLVGGMTRAFLPALTDGLRGEDFAYGATASALHAVVLAMGVRLVGASLLSRRWRLVPKLFVVWVALQGLAYATGYVGRWFA